MNKLILTGLMLLLIVTKGYGQDAFITTWKTDNAGASCSSCITIPTFAGETYNFDVDWNNDGVFDSIGVTGPITHDYGIAGTNSIAIKGVFPRIYFNNGGDKEKILQINQWGDISWKSMARAFSGCSNMDLVAVDAPNLTGVQDMSGMFRFCSTLVGNSSFSGWDVSYVNNMADLFQFATMFNQYIGSWNTINVSNMGYMFFEASSFNQAIGNWNTINVTSMVSMFRKATSFNQPIGGWNTAQIGSMSNMFEGATSFNQPIGNWNISNVNSLENTFRNASSFNQNLSSWNTSSVTNMHRTFYGASSFNGTLDGWNTSMVWNMSDMFYSATSFNQPINSWNTGNVQQMQGMFSWASSFNQPIWNWDTGNVIFMYHMFSNAVSYNQPVGTWNTGNVQHMYRMFSQASSFNQTLGNWNLQSIIVSGFFDNGLENMLNGSGLDVNNYDNTLIGWAAQSVPYNVNLGAFGLSYCRGEIAREHLINNFSWIIQGDIIECPLYFTSTWKTTNSGISLNNQITFPGSGNYNVLWTKIDNSSFGDTSLTGVATITFPDTGIYRVFIDSGLHRIEFNNLGDANKILSIEQWGDIKWSSMFRAFAGCNNLQLNATDIPDLSNVTNCGAMFRGCTNLIGDSTMNDWDMLTIDTMLWMFYLAKNFNVPIGNWNTENVVDMRAMFFECDSFNQDIGNWNTSRVKSMKSMFYRSKSFNQDIGNWVTDSVTDMSFMFRENPVFNQDIGNWNTSQVTDMSSMFGLTVSFNQDIGNWDVRKVTKMTSMFAVDPSFNQDLSSWDVSNVTNFDYTFAQASAFNQNLGVWDISSASSMFQMVGASGLSITNYDSTLINWATQVVQPNVVFGATSKQYCTGKSARDSLIQLHGWIISGDEFIGENKWTGLGDGTTWEDDNNWSKNHQPLNFEIAQIDIFPPASISMSSDTLKASALEVINGNVLTVNPLGKLTLDGSQGCHFTPVGILVSGSGSTIINNGSLISNNAQGDQMMVDQGAIFNGSGILDTE